MATSVFIDGAVGTTGLEIRDRLSGRPELSLIALADEERKDAVARKAALNDADIVILCLPDDAAREAVALIDNGRTKVIDASTAHRVAAGWTYGFPELEPGHAEAVSRARFVANPGCWPTGFLALVRPLVRAGLIPVDWPISVGGASGYSGGGKAMIAEFEDTSSPTFTDTAFRVYGLAMGHKHVPEMLQYSGLVHPPLFSPAVVRAYRGMLVEVPLQLRAMPGRPTLAALHATLAEAYEGSPIVTVAPIEESAAMRLITVETTGATDRLNLFLFGSDDNGQARLVATLDNLGKGAAGAAVQNLNLMADLPETAGLRL